MASSVGYRGVGSPRDGANELNTQSFLVKQLLNKTSIATLVKVVKVTNSPGELKTVGRLDAQPLVNQVHGDGQSIEHKTIYGLCYHRYGGGKNAVILDPEPGDIGMAVFSDRDISAVKRTLKASDPGSARRFDMSDGVYTGTILSKHAPEQFVRFVEDGIEVVDKHGNKVTMNNEGVNVLGPGGNKIRITENGIDLN